MKLQELIDKAAEKVTNSKEGTPERAQAEAELNALKAAQGADDLFDQTHVNNLVAAEKRQVKETQDRIEKAFGTDLAGVETVLGSIEAQLTGDQTGQQTGDQTGQQTGQQQTGDQTGQQQTGAISLTALQTELQKRDEEIQNLKTGTTEFQRGIHREKVEDQLRAQLKSMGLVSVFQNTAETYLKNVVGYDDLVDKAMKGEAITEEELAGKVTPVKEASSPWFAESNPDFPGIPPSPEGDNGQPLTDEQRREKSLASGGQVF